MDLRLKSQQEKKFSLTIFTLLSTYTRWTMACSCHRVACPSILAKTRRTAVLTKRPFWTSCKRGSKIGEEAKHGCVNKNDTSLWRPSFPLSIQTTGSGDRNPAVPVPAFQGSINLPKQTAFPICWRKVCQFCLECGGSDLLPRDAQAKGSTLRLESLEDG